MILKPANAAAETIRSLRSINDDIATQIDTLTATRESNLQVISSLEPVAEWTEFEE